MLLVCRAKMMKAVNMTYKHGGDDLYQNRLFSYLQKQLKVKINEMKPIRKNVYFIEGENIEFILKGFSSYQRYMNQNDLSEALLKEGFSQTYSFYQLANSPPLFFEKKYYGTIEYLQPSEESFTYSEEKHQKEALDLLARYHTATEKLTETFKDRLSVFKQVDKWVERTSIFLSHLPVVRYYVQKEIINELLYWADWSLKGIRQEGQMFKKGKKVILHGDVAHHNFLRGRNNQLYLIDFDLISLGTPHCDYLQFANRILPNLDWSFEKLSSFDRMAPYLHEKGFIYGLGFPTDIFREWNRAIRDRTYLSNEDKINQLLEITVSQFKARQEFFKELKNQIAGGY